MTCTFLIILVQFFCNKKYNCPKPDVSPESSCYETDNEIEVPKPKKKKKKDQTNIPMEKKDLPKNKKKVSIEEQKHESIIFDEPQSDYPTFCKKSSLHLSNACHTNHNEQSSPSFNLPSNKKSTPIRPNQNCRDFESSIGHSIFPTSSKSCQTNKNLSETVVEIHAPNSDSNIQTDELFYSC